MERFAIFFAPATGTALAAFGKAWFAGAAWADWTRPDAARMADLLRAPRHYGFHATLKPPFARAPGATAATLFDRLETFAAGLRPFATAPLVPRRLGDFLALCPPAPAPELHALADNCVRDFDDLRAPAGPAEIAKRRLAGLNPRQEELLAAWGYPYVFDEFRFHMTLTGPIGDAAEAAEVLTGLRPLLTDVAAEPLRIDDICLFHQPDRDTPFALLQRFALAGGATAAPCHALVTEQDY